jgi:hypothetical protein
METLSLLCALSPHFIPPNLFFHVNLVSACCCYRDASAWAAEGGKLYVMGGSLGSLSGYTASVEVYDAATDRQDANHVSFISGH